MIGKLKKNQSTEKNAKDQSPEGEKTEPQALSGAPKIAVAGLGVLIMVIGIGFVLMQMMGGGNSNRQQMMAQAQRAQQEQANKDLQALMDKDSKPQQSGQDMAQGEKKPEPTGHSPQAADDFKKKALKKPSADRGQMPAPQASAEPAAEPANSRPARGSPAQPGSESVKFTGSQMEKIMERLAAIEESVNNRIDNITSSVEELKHGIAANGDKIMTVVDQVKNSSGSSVDAEKYAQLINRKEELQEKVAAFKERVEELEGKYEWVRHLETEKRQKLKQAKLELEEAREELAKLAKRPVFGEWEVAGLSSKEMLLVNPYNGEVKRLNVGQSFQGVTVEKIDAANGKVHTNAGIVTLG